MILTSQIVDLNLSPKGVMPVVYVSQYDVGRRISYRIYDGSQTVDLSDYKVYLAGIKPDGNIFCYDSANNSNIITKFDICTSEQMTACNGDVLCQIRLEKTTGGVTDTVATLNFKMLVQERPDSDGDISDTEIPAIIELAREEQYNAEAWAKGTKNGTAVSSSDPQYNNHAEYWAGIAEQYAEMLMSSYIFKGDCSDSADTVAKEVYLDDMDHMPTNGDLFLINFENGNSVDATLSVNGYSAKTWGAVGTHGNVAREARYVLLKYNGSTYETMASDAPAIAGSVSQPLSLGAVDENGLQSGINYYGSAKKRLYFVRFIERLLSGGWSATANADGYYTQSVSFLVSSGGASRNVLINTYYPVRVRPCGSTINTLPTAAEGAAYNLVDHYGANDGETVANVTFYTKEKPTVSFYVCVEAYTNGEV